MKENGRSGRPHRLKQVSYSVILLVLTGICAVLFRDPASFARGKKDSAGARPDAPQKVTAAGDSVSFTVAGDIMVHDAQLESAWNEEENRYDFDSVFQYVTSLLSGSDLTLGNLETTLPGKKELYSGYPSFGAPNSLAEALKRAGFDILANANNHICDKGRNGLVNTLDILDSLGIFHLGAYRSKEEREANRVLVMEKNRIRFAFLNYTYGTNSLRDPGGTVVSRMEPDSMAVDLGLARSKDADFIIVLLHFGTEYARQPNEAGKRIVHSLFKLGADIVLGSHPHVLQPYFIETLTDTFGLAKPRLVIYSLGNFLSNQRRRYTNGGILLHFTLKKTTGETGGTATAIGPVSFTPVWVYIHQTATGKKYFVFPAGSFLEQSPFPIPHASYNAMKLFYEDTCEHLGCRDSTITGDR